MKQKQIQTNFQRIETKYVLDIETLQKLETEMHKFLIEDDYASSTISNIYFDNDDFQMIQDSIARRNGREKIRMRSYSNEITEDSQVFLEIKKKSEEVGYKYRLASNPVSVVNFVKNAQIDATISDERVQNEVEQLQNRYLGLKPKMMISYDRYSMKGSKDKKVRVTVDSNIRYRDYDLDLTLGRYGLPLLDEGKAIMEIKVPGEYPNWLATILNKYGLEDQSFSKYANAYLKSENRIVELVQNS
ncbi:MAG: polyphosphate polymerase domain-containing protein [Streptococcus sp.]|nr:polyphosphate polymerase domain-containing protein [Streptococcus sp.]